MSEHLITSTLDYMVSKYGYVTICDDFKFTSVPVEGKGDIVQKQIELINPKDYSWQEVKDKYDLNTKVIKWFDTYTDDGKESMAVVLEG